MPRAIAVIPARFGSERFPGKPLAAETGRPLIQHVYERAVEARSVGRVLVATDDQRIVEAVESFGGDAIMTRADHPNGTSRIAEVVEKLDAQTADNAPFIVNLQGDEPEIEPRLIDLAIDALAADDDAVVSTVASPFAPDENPANPNIVKVVCDARGRAMYFSRSLIPFDREGSGRVGPLKHIGLYVYRRAFLPAYAALPPAPLEQTERLEQLRVLEHGHAIAVVVAEAHHHGIDTPEQYAAFVERVRAGQETRPGSGSGNPDI